MQRERTYIAIDLKSFYASVECVERGLDPLNTNLVVADVTRTEKTICLAVSPSLKAYGIAGRARLFEVVERIHELNDNRKYNSTDHQLHGKSIYHNELEAHKNWAVDYIAAPPRMAHYIDYSTKIYGIYLKYIAPEDIHIYSIDEVFMDVTDYLKSYRMTAHQLAIKMIRDVLKNTGITATAGIGTNLYLCKVAMDIVAKHANADTDGVRIAELNEMAYRRKLWNHRPLTDFWRIGRGTARKLETFGIDTMGKLARFSLHHSPLLYKMFGVNAEFLIDHAWGYESCLMKDIKAYRPRNHSLCSGQVLQHPYTFKQGLVVAQEMADMLALSLVEKRKMTDHITLAVGYDRTSLDNPIIQKRYMGPITKDRFGRIVPKTAHGSYPITQYTSSGRLIMDAISKLYEDIVNPLLKVRRITIVASHVIDETLAKHQNETPIQLNLFENNEEKRRDALQERHQLARERKLQEATLDIKRRFGKNSLLRGLNFDEGATGRERNNQIGGHHA